MKIFILLWIIVLILLSYASCIVSPTYAPATTSTGMESLPLGAPTPPNLNAEQLVLPDFNLLKPSNVQLALPSQGPSGSSPSLNPVQSLPIMPVQGCANCIDKTAWTNCKGQGCPTSCGSVSPEGFIAQGCQAVFPHLTAYKCNSYYIQHRPGQLCIQAGVRCGEWLTLLSNIGRAGTYWSYEWAQCGSSYCYPEVKNFGNKGSGWYQTWFNSNKPGWHVLSYWCNDWSNYIYIYVWPSD
jgi:hypothetical protein